MKLSKILKVMTMVLGVMFFFHAFFYFSLIRFFQLEDSRNLVSFALIMLTLTFPFMILVDRIMHNILTQFLAALSGIWMATALYLIPVLLVLWIVWLGFFLSGVAITDSIVFWWLSRGLVLGMFLFVLYGVLLAWKIKIRSMNVSIQNLPEYWEGKKILQISDVHIGSIWGNGRLKKISRIILKAKPDLVVITGDLFDGASGGHNRYLAGLQSLAATNPPEGMYFTSGNHERYSNYQSIMSVVEKSGISLLENRLVNLNGLQLVGIQYPDFTRPGKKTVEESSEYNFQSDPGYQKKLPVVLLYHVPVEYNHSPENMSEMQQGAYMKPDTEFITARKQHVDLQLSGHTHAGQFFPFAPITKKIFHGFHYGLHRIDNFQIYIHAGTGTWGMPLRHGIPGEVALFTLQSGDRK